MTLKPEKNYWALVFIKGLGRIFVTALSLGGTARIRTAGENYDSVFCQYQPLRERLDELEADNHAELELIGQSTTLAFAALYRAEKLLGIAADSTPESRAIDASTLATQVARIERLSERRSTALAATSGAATGSMAVVGAWSLVAMAGTASTGTAIGTLSGAAATSATLAWFGGGSLVAGGAGMAGGEVVLAVIAFLPVIACWGFFAHRKAKKIEHATNALNSIIPKLPAEIQRMEAAYSKIAAYRQELNAASEALADSVAAAEKKLFPLKALSRLKRWLVSKFGGRYFKDKEEQIIVDVQHHVDCFLKLYES
jgi:hypothetical protein